MRTLAEGYKGFFVFVRLNKDRAIYTGTLIAALYAGAYIALL